MRALSKVEVMLAAMVAAGPVLAAPGNGGARTAQERAARPANAPRKTVATLPAIPVVATAPTSDPTRYLALIGVTELGDRVQAWLVDLTTQERETAVAGGSAFGFTVRQVKPESVVLNRGGRDYTLRLGQKAVPPRTGIPVVAPARLPNGRATVPATANPRATAPPPTDPESREEVPSGERVESPNGGRNRTNGSRDTNGRGMGAYPQEDGTPFGNPFGNPYLNYPGYPPEWYPGNPGAWPPEQGGAGAPPYPDYPCALGPYDGWNGPPQAYPMDFQESGLYSGVAPLDRAAGPIRRGGRVRTPVGLHPFNPQTLRRQERTFGGASAPGPGQLAPRSTNPQTQRRRTATQR